MDDTVMGQVSLPTGDEERPLELSELHAFTGPAEAFWPVYLDAVCHALMAHKVVLLLKGAEQRWQGVLFSPRQAVIDGGEAPQLLALANASDEQAVVRGQLESGTALLALRLPISPDPTRPKAV